MTGFSLAPALAAILSTPLPRPETFSNIPPTLSGDDKKQVRIKHPKFAKALQCTSKCVATCIRGGEGPLNVRRPLLVFKEQFRSRQYWQSAQTFAISSRMEKMGHGKSFCPGEAAITFEATTAKTASANVLQFF